MVVTSLSEPVVCEYHFEIEFNPNAWAGMYTIDAVFYNRYKIRNQNFGIFLDKNENLISLRT